MEEAFLYKKVVRCSRTGRLKSNTLSRKKSIKYIIRKSMKKYTLSLHLLCKRHCLGKFFNIMRLSTLGLFACAFATYAADMDAQTAKVNITNSRMTIGAFIEQVEKETGYMFVYNKREVDANRTVSLEAGSSSVADCLNRVFEGSGITYVFDDDYIVLTKRGGKQTLSVARQIGKNISGVIVDETGQPIVGANVVEKGTTNGTVTDMDGKFSIHASSDKAILVVSYIGYVDREISVKGQKNWSITLKEDLHSLDEVVVIGYGTVAKKELTSAVSHVSSKDFLNIGSNNPVMQIQGKVSGVSIVNTAAADPNSSTSIQVRGVSSRSAGVSPLIIIDGVPGGNLSNVNENDIESIDVLKDGAASAIYGTRGSNGVIIVTTKKGAQDGAVHTGYTGYVNISTPKKQLEVLNADEFRQHMPERGTDFGANTDWFDEITRTGFSHNHTFQVSGGTAKNNYRASVDVRNSTGIDIRSDRKELGARFSVNHSASNDLYKVTVNVAPRTIKYNNSDHSVFSQALTLNPTMPVKDPENPNLYYETTGWEAQNPVEMLRLEKSEGERKFLDWDGTFKLNLLPLFAPDKGHMLSTQITIAQQINDVQSFWFRPSTSTLARKSGFKGEASQNYDKNRQESLEWLINYGFEKNNHHLKVVGGYSYQYFVNQGLAANNKNFTSDALMYNKLQDGTYMSEVEGRLGMSSYKNDAKLIAFFGRVSYDYQGKYLATASLRYEGSSKFGANNKWGYFPAVSAGWRISEEEFLKDVNWIDDLKIRGDFGVTGNQNFDSYKALSTMRGYGQAYYSGKYYQGWSPGVNVNPDLKWEKGKNWNIGLDFTLFDRILTGSLNYFNRTQQDLLGDYAVSLPPNIQSSSFVNVGTMRNSGFEFDLTIDAVRTKDFNYSITFVGSTMNNHFISFSNDVFKGQNYYWLSSFPAPGYPGELQRIQENDRIGSFYTYQYAGVDESGNWLVKNKDGETIPIGEATGDDKVKVGNGLPKFTMSWNNSFKYKNFDLSLFFRGNFGYQVYNVHDFYWGLRSSAANLNILKSAYEKNAHITTGMNLHNSYFVDDVNFLKLDVATLGYTVNVNSKWLKKARLYFTGRNMFTITRYDGVDPDIFPINGLEPGVPSGKKSYYPSTRQYLIGIQLNF